MLVQMMFAAVLAGTGQTGATVDVFYKELPPSLEALARTEEVLAEFAGEFTITRHLITDEATAPLIAAYGLPETHFPFAVVVNGKLSAVVDGERVDFVHFPLFMHGIGRHEGNWSMELLGRVLADPSLMVSGVELEELDETGWTECMDE